MRINRGSPRWHRALLILLVPASGLLCLAQTLDEGLLDPKWFSPDPLEFRESGKLDYLWVRPGFTLEGRTVQFIPWTSPNLPAPRDEKDRAAAQKFHEGFPPRVVESFKQQLAGKATVVPIDGELRVFGRIVDCNAGNPWAYVWPNYTFELRLVDGADVLQVAIHTRFVGKATKANIGAWAKKVVEPFKDGIESAWRGGKAVGS